jgi:hypothetical protein
MGLAETKVDQADIMLKLYVSEECELCDRAIAVLAEARAPDFECVGIEDDAELDERYGVRVPVLRDVASARELGWPFDVADVARFLGRSVG